MFKGYNTYVYPLLLQLPCLALISYRCMLCDASREERSSYAYSVTPDQPDQRDTLFAYTSMRPHSPEYRTSIL